MGCNADAVKPGCHCSSRHTQARSSPVALHEQVTAEVCCQVHCGQGRAARDVADISIVGCFLWQRLPTRWKRVWRTMRQDALSHQPRLAAAGTAAASPPVKATSIPQCTAAPSRVNSRASGELGPAQRAPQQRHVCGWQVRAQGGKRELPALAVQTKACLQACKMPSAGLHQRAFVLVPD